MTQHYLQEQTQQDQHTMRRLSLVIGGFMLATILLAIVVTRAVG